MIISFIGCKDKSNDDNSALNSMDRNQSVTHSENNGDIFESDPNTGSSIIMSETPEESTDNTGVSESIKQTPENNEKATISNISSNSGKSFENSNGDSSETSKVDMPGENISETDPNYYDILRPWYNIGHNKQLRGTPVIYAIFMDDDESSWDTLSIESFLRYEIKPAVEYLENEASKWGIELDISIKTFATVLNQGYTINYEGIVNRNLRESPSTKDVLEKAAMDFGYISEEDINDSISAANGGNEIIFLCILNKDGTCYTRNQITNGSTTLVEEIVLFRRPLNYPEWLIKNGERASVVAHEILHLFGAQDFYITESREKLAEQYYPDDIMLWQYYDINKNKLGDCVAYSIGWTNTVPAVCYNEEWWQ